MPNKRLFKKYVDYVAADAVEEMMVSYVNEPDVDKKLLGEAVGKVLDAQDAARKNSNVKFDRSCRSFASKEEYSAEKRKFFKALFDKIFRDFDAALEEAVKLFNQATPKEVKDARKA